MDREGIRILSLNGNVNLCVKSIYTPVGSAGAALNAAVRVMHIRDGFVASGVARVCRVERCGCLVLLRRGCLVLQGDEKEDGREVLDDQSVEVDAGSQGDGAGNGEISSGRRLRGRGRQSERVALAVPARRIIEPHEKAEIVRQYMEEGRTVADIGRDLGIERAAIHHTIARLKLLKPVELNSYITEIFEHSLKIQTDLLANLASEDYREMVEPQRLRAELELFRVISERFQKLMATVQVVKQHHPQSKTPGPARAALRPGVIDGELVED